MNQELRFRICFFDTDYKGAENAREEEHSFAELLHTL
jgi:hypothetical protein